MNRRKFLRACGAVLAACAVEYSTGRAQTASSGPRSVYLPIVVNNASMSGGDGSPLPYAVDFLLMPDGAPLPSGLRGPTWSARGGAANNAPALLNQLHPNGAMESGSPPTGYAVDAASTVASTYNEERTGGVGTRSQRLALIQSSGAEQVNPPVAASPGDWFHSEVWLKNGSLATGLLPSILSSGGSALAVYSAHTLLDSANWDDFYAGSTWALRVLTAQSSDAAIVEQINIGGSANQYGLVDDFFCYKLAPRDLLATMQGAADYCCSVRSRVDAKMRQFGLALNVDDPNNPMNYLLVWFDRLNSQVVVNQYVSGVMAYRSVFPEANSFAFLALTAVKTGAALNVYWGGVRVNPSPIPVSAALVNNPYMGFMSPYEGGIVKFNAAAGAATKNILCYGDSKFVRDFPGIVKNLSGGALIAVESPARIAVSGRTTLGAYQALSTDLGGAVGTPDFIFYNLGANDYASIANGYVNETTWKQYTGAILDAMHARWPNARIYAAHAWVASSFQFGISPDTLAAWLDSVLAPRAGWAFAGPDERVYLNNGDNGASLTVDGVHPNALGEYRTSQEWRKCVGYE